MDLYQDIEVYFQAHADEKIVKKYARYFKAGQCCYDAYGIESKKFAALLSQLKSDKAMNLPLALSLGGLLVQGGKYEQVSLAIELLGSFAGQFDYHTFRQVEQFFDYGIANWAHCDSFCSRIMAEFFRRRIIKLPDLGHWRSAENKYQRRAVPVSMLEILDDNSDFAALFAFITPLMMDNEKKVQQGLGWFLRQAWKYNHAAAESFLLQWKDCAPRIIFQYATEKMDPAARKQFRKSKKTIIPPAENGLGKAKKP